MFKHNLESACVV